MNQWLPVIGTLSGAAVAGAISYLISWRSGKNSMEQARLSFAEERARWATELQLDNFKRLHNAVDKLLDATVQIRIQQAWELRSENPPAWVLSANDARERFENATWAVASEVIFLESDIRERVEVALRKKEEWFMAMPAEKGVEKLQEMESELHDLLGWIATRYRECFEARRAGKDLQKS